MTDAELIRHSRALRARLDQRVRALDQDIKNSRTGQSPGSGRMWIVIPSSHLTTYSLPVSRPTPTVSGALLMDRAPPQAPGIQAGDSPGLLQKVVEIQPPREHRQFAAGGARPCLRWTVPVQFDAVLVRISQVERLADTMVSGAVERDARPHHAAQSVGESGPRRVQDGVVVESRRARRRGRATQAFPGVEADVMMVATRRDKRRAASVTLRQL